MTVRAAYKIDDKQIGEMDLTISISMKVSEWRAMRSTMGTTWPCYDVMHAIDQALSQIGNATDKRFTIPKEE